MESALPDSSYFLHVELRLRKCPQKGTHCSCSGCWVCCQTCHSLEWESNKSLFNIESHWTQTQRHEFWSWFQAVGSEAKHLSSSDKNREWLARALQLQCLMLRGCLRPWNSHKMWPINIKYLLFQSYKREPKCKMHHWLGNSSLLLAAIYVNREDIKVKVTKAIKGLYRTPSLWGG